MFKAQPSWKSYVLRQFSGKEEGEYAGGFSGWAISYTAAKTDRHIQEILKNKIHPKFYFLHQ